MPLAMPFRNTVIGKVISLHNMKSTTKYCNFQKISHKRVLRELNKGKKLTIWMLYTFPCIAGRFKNPFIKCFEIKNYSELQAFVSDRLIYRHLRQYFRVLLSLKESNIESILGKYGAERFESFLTMLLYTKKFKHFAENLLIQYYNGNIDIETDSIMRKEIENGK